MIRYAKPKTVEEALGLLTEGRWRILAGGTDFYPAQGARPVRDNVLDINGLSELRGIAETPHHWSFGARTTWTDVVRAKLPSAFDALRQAAREVGSVQIQNVGTIAGNLCNASPAADGVPPLLVLDADLELRSLAGARHLPLQAFILGNRKTARRDDELLTAIRVPKRCVAGNSAFVKLGARRYLVISIAMAAARLELSADGTLTRAAIAVGSCSAAARRLIGLEAALAGLRPGEEFAEAIRDAPLSELMPIDDVRGTAEYRIEAAREIVLRALEATARPESSERRAA
ncbi:xanthine dehydrogenase family protein subunit M [Mesorhizobium sp. CN2-181]|uniref:FAD binding domain-containing protein n=1 Tax=Mesorhizobium yinganensis TaxID=3157707 RepID=UPI0032B78F4B